MAGEQFDYPTLLSDALRGVVRAVLTTLQREGLTSDLQPHITFFTTAPGVVIPKFLLAEYPEEMTISFGRNRFRDLEIDATGCSVTLQFNGRPQRLDIPFAAMTGFSDPAVRFALPLPVFTDEPADADTTDTSEIAPPDERRTNLPVATATQEPAPPPTPSDAGAGNVIAINSFRRK